MNLSKEQIQNLSNDELLLLNRLLKEKHQIRAKSSLLEFITYTYHKYNPQWFQRYVCNVFDQFSRGQINRLMVFMPPQHGKSEIMTRRLPPYLFGLSPDEKIILCTYNATFASKFNRQIQRIIDSEEYKEVFKETKLNDKNISTDRRGSYIRNSEEFEIVGHSGFLKTVGVGGGIAGNPADTALLDDVIKDVAEAESITYRNKIYDWYTDELETRLHNDSKVAFTITRRHEDDLAGRLLKRDGIIEEGGKWKIIKLPAIKEDNNSDYDVRKIGEALWGNKHSIERLRDVEKNNARTFISLYQQRPSPQEGNKIKRDWFKIIKLNEIPFSIDHEKVDIWIDGAFTENTKNDPTALMACVKYNENVYILNSVQKWLELYELLDYFPAFAKANYHNSRGKVFIEPKASGKPIKSMLNKQGYNCIEINDKIVKYGKMGRVNNSEPTIQTGKIYLIEGTWNSQFINECCTFPNGEYDDQLDNLCYAVHEYYIQHGKVQLKPASFYNS